jgi:RES domain-containing protein
LIRVYRLNRKAYRDQAYSGLGASRSPGRWNLAGTPVVYTSATESLAFLELFVNLPTITLRSLDREYECIAADLTSNIYTVNLASLPHDWRNLSALPHSTQVLGTQWMDELRHLVISVPSAVFPGERNYLINPRHPDFAAQCLVQPEQPIIPDPRILAKLP